MLIEKARQTALLAAALAAILPLTAHAAQQNRAAPARAAPHVSAPHMSAPHMSAGPRFSAPRVTHSAPHMSVQRQFHVNRNATVRSFNRPSVHLQNRHVQNRNLRNRNVLNKQLHNRNLQAHSNTLQNHATRAERLKERRAERRALRGVPRALRAEKLKEFRAAHANRNAPNATASINRKNRDLTQGRFTSAFASKHDRHHRGDWLSARRAWRHHHRAFFVPWYGGVFWPYAYSDIFDYAFWPYGYDDGYWAYAYDDFFDGIFWGGYAPGDVYAYAPSSSRRSTSGPRVTSAGVAELCKAPGNGVTAWPFAEIESKVGLSNDQKELLAELRNAATKASDAFKTSCPANQAFPLTPPGRLQAMMARLDATLQAVEIVRPPLEKFYNSLSDEQKARFNQLGPQNRPGNEETKAALPAQAQACKEAKPGLTNLPIEQIQNALKPGKEQQAKLDRLGESTVKAVGILQAACPDATPITPPGRLEAMETRLKAMLDAANTVKSPLESFYASLTSEQKARFNRLGSELAQAND